MVSGAYECTEGRGGRTGPVGVDVTDVGLLEETVELPGNDR